MNYDCTSGFMDDVVFSNNWLHGASCVFQSGDRVQQDNRRDCNQILYEYIHMREKRMIFGNSLKTSADKYAE